MHRSIRIYYVQEMHKIFEESSLQLWNPAPLTRVRRFYGRRRHILAGNSWSNYYIDTRLQTFILGKYFLPQTSRNSEMQFKMSESISYF